MLHLEVTSYEGLPPDHPASLHVGNGIYAIGRNPENDLALSDPERLVSGRHARIEVRDDGIWLIDESTNGTSLNQSAERLPTHQPVALHDGDILSVGPYEIAVSIETDDLGMVADPFVSEDPAFAGIGGPGAAPDIMELLGGSSGQPAGNDGLPPEDPFADAHPLDAFLTGPAPEDDAPRAAEPHPTPVENVYFRSPEIQAFPDGYDLMSDELPCQTGAPVGKPEALPAAKVEPQQLPPVEPMPIPGENLDLSVDLKPAQDLGPLVTPAPGPPHGEPKHATAPPARRDEAFRPAERAPSPNQRAEFQSEVQPEPEPASQPGPQLPTADLLAAFLAGLGSADSVSVKDPAALLHDAGALLRVLTAGLSATMIARAQFKSELRLGVTTIRRAENNPFKFSASPDEAMERLLLRPNPAYMPPLDAAREAFEDIQAHEMAMIAGLRAALRALLARFEPSTLEARLEAASGLDKLLPMARKSRYWDQFTQMYGQVAADAAEDFMELFGEAFSRAYEDQVLRLAQARGQRSS